MATWPRGLQQQLPVLSSRRAYVPVLIESVSYGYRITAVCVCVCVCPRECTRKTNETKIRVFYRRLYYARRSFVLIETAGKRNGRF